MLCAKVVPELGIQAVCRRKLRHLEAGVDVLEALSQNLQGAPHLGVIFLDGFAVAIQLSDQAVDEFLLRVRIVLVVGSELGPDIGLGRLDPGDRIFREQRRALVVPGVIGETLLVGNRALEQPAVILQVRADLVFEDDFLVDFGGHAMASLAGSILAFFRTSMRPRTASVMVDARNSFSKMTSLFACEISASKRSVSADI